MKYSPEEMKANGLKCTPFCFDDGIERIMNTDLSDAYLELLKAKDRKEGKVYTGKEADNVEFEYRRAANNWARYVNDAKLHVTKGKYSALFDICASYRRSRGVTNLHGAKYFMCSAEQVRDYIKTRKRLKRNEKKFLFKYIFGPNEDTSDL